MHAAVVTTFDTAPRYQEFPAPVPADEDEMLVDVLAAGLHPRVRSQANGSHYTSTDELPLVPGIDGVGRGPERHPLTQRDPGRHGRVHRRGHHDRIDGAGQHQAAPDVDDRLLGHRAHRGVWQDEVPQQPVGSASDAVDARHERQLIGARVVRPVSLGSDPRMQSGGQDTDEHLAVGRDGDRELLIARSSAEPGDNSSVHADLQRIWTVGNTNYISCYY
jgi:hypothetical protein